MTWAPLRNCNIVQKSFAALDLFCCHRESSPYFHDIRCLLLGTVTQRSLINKQVGRCKRWEWPPRSWSLKPSANSWCWDSKSGDVVSDAEEFEKKTSNNYYYYSKPQQKNHRLKMKRGDVRVKTRGGLTALVWKDRRSLHGNMDQPPEENFYDDSKRPMKPHIVERYNRHTGFVNSSDRMANSYSMSRRNFKWTTKLFSHLLDVTVLNNWIVTFMWG